LRIDRRLGTLRGPLQEAALPLAVSRFAARRDINMGSASLAGCSILICEDEPLIALGIADAFTNAGARVLTVRSLADALAAVEDEVPSAAILDHALSDRESSQLCGPLPVDHTLDRLGIVRAAPLIEEDGGERGRRDKLPKLRGQPRELREVWQARGGGLEAEQGDQKAAPITHAGLLSAMCLCAHEARERLDLVDTPS
jgi:hypothetical protein